MMEFELFRDLSIRDVRLKNRIVASPMLTYAAQDGFAGDWHLMHLGRFAAGGAGLVMMEATGVEAIGRTTSRDVGLWSDPLVPPLARIAAFLRGLGAATGIQLNHAGRKRRNLLPWGEAAGSETVRDGDVVGPSALAHAAGYPIPREATLGEIQGFVRAWGDAARRADAAGFDVLELHGAHGYQLHQFLSPAANRRRDSYGGSLANRMRFVIEVVESVRSSWPATKPLFLRLSCIDDAGWTIEDSVALARVLKPLGVDVIDCSSGGITASHVLDARQIPYGYQTGFAEQIRAEASVISVAVGLIVHADQAEEILRARRADLVALGRELLHNPNWPMDAAQKLGRLPGSPGIPAAYAFWLDKRAANNSEIQPSTWRRGLGNQ